MDLTFPEWLETTEQKRLELLSYSRSPLPTDPGERQLDVSKALSEGQDAGDLLADIESFLIQSEAQATLDVKKRYDELSADERKVMAKDATRDIRHLRDGMAVIVRTIHDRKFALMNLNRS